MKQEKELTKELEVQVKELTRKNLDLKSEIEGVRTASQLNTEEQTESIKSAHQEEIASLQHIYQGKRICSNLFQLTMYLCWLVSFP